MARKRFSPEEIIHKLREAEVLLAEAELDKAILREAASGNF